MRGRGYNYGETQSGTWSRRTSLSPTVWGHLRAFASNLEPRSSWRAGSGVGFFVGEDRIGRALRLKSWRPRPLPLVCLSPSLRGGLGVLVFGCAGWQYRPGLLRPTALLSTLIPQCATSRRGSAHADSLDCAEKEEEAYKDQVPPIK